jgi:hypothetical protein
MPYPDTKNHFLAEHVTLIRNSYRLLLKSELIEGIKTPEQFAKSLFHAPFAVISHNTAHDPIFNYANLAALKLFEFSWEEMTQLPSKYSAEPISQAERAKLLTEVVNKGFINHYYGIRISKTGRRFLIQDAIVWNLLSAEGNYTGQAACIKKWQYL